jgi:hypothetical protein
LKFGYRILDIVNTYALQVKNRPLALWWDIAVNLADDRESAALEEDLAWGLGVTLSKIKEKGTWELSADYRRVEADAVFAAFNDIDFAGTNRRGFRLGAGYQLFDSLSLNLTTFITENIDEELNTSDQDYVRWQLDATVKF